MVVTAPHLEEGSNNRQEGMCGSKTCAFSAHAGTFECFQVEIPIFPFASGNASTGSTFPESWSFQQAKEKETQERGEGCQEELVKFQSKFFRSQNLNTNIIKALCFLKLLWCLANSFFPLPSVPLSWASEDSAEVSSGGWSFGSSPKGVCRQAPLAWCGMDSHESFVGLSPRPGCSCGYSI